MRTHSRGNKQYNKRYKSKETELKQNKQFISEFDTDIQCNFKNNDYKIVDDSEQNRNNPRHKPTKPSHVSLTIEQFQNDRYNYSKSCRNSLIVQNPAAKSINNAKSKSYF